MYKNDRLVAAVVATLVSFFSNAFNVSIALTTRIIINNKHIHIFNKYLC